VIAPPPASDVTRYTAQYELLRTQVMGIASERACGREAQSPHGIGLALLLRAGMPGWLKAIEAVLHAAPTTPTCTRAPWDGFASTALASGPRRELTTLLASLVLSTRRLGGLSPTEGY